ncbi:MAG: signal peptidase I [Treponema sp.]|nr:signal peptidase I [Treponema sp.]
MKQNVYDYSFELRRIRSRRITFALSVVIFTFLFISLFLNFILFPVHVKSDSMESDIAKGSAVFITPLIRTPKRGDVYYISRMDNVTGTLFQKAANTIVKFVTLQKFYPFGYTDRMSGKPFLRRVLALPGDSIYMKDYVLYIKPKGEKLFLTEFELTQKAYNTNIYSVPAEWENIGVSGFMKEITLGNNEYFVLSDNRIECSDSRLWGPVKADRLKGRALLEYFPFNKIHLF